VAFSRSGVLYEHEMYCTRTCGSYVHAVSSSHRRLHSTARTRGAGLPHHAARSTLDCVLCAARRGMRICQVASARHAARRTRWQHATSLPRLYVVQATKDGYQEPSSRDGLLEVVGFKSAWHTGAVLTSKKRGVRLCQAAGVRLRVRGGDSSKQGAASVYLHLDGEPWKQSIPEGGESSDLTVRCSKQHAMLR
jgi:Diacylglycerol kinase accessory domain